MNANDFVIFALKSPLHVIMGDTMLVTVTGRKTGRKITVPVNYYREGDDLWILSSRERTWWRNLLHGGPVCIHLHGRDFKGLGEVIQDEPAVTAHLTQYVKHLPQSARYFGLRVEDGQPNCDDLARAAKERLFIHICLQH
ncbi:MAG: nitroreductase/quinone reductase family protein [Anaerolineae bacterium]